MTRLPNALLALATVLALIVLGEMALIYVTFGVFEPVYLIFVGSSLPFLGVMLVGGWWLRQGNLPEARHRRIAGWTGAGIAFWGGLFLVVGLITMPPEQIWGAVRWGVSVGGGSGFLVGLFEARAIEHERQAERRRTRAVDLKRRKYRLEDFTRIVSHDLRNPLSVAFARLDLARAETDNEHLATVERSLTRMETILTDTLDLARQGQVITEPESVDLDEVVRRAWENVQTGPANLEVTLDRTVQGDAERLASVFENLFRNAIEHGGDDLVVRVGPLEDEAGFYVEDNGPGVAPDERDTVFEPGESSKDDGTGFGLTIVRGIVAAHDWDIDLTESADGGARFDVRTQPETATTAQRADREERSAIAA